jgi:hypothetical protein
LRPPLTLSGPVAVMNPLDSLLNSPLDDFSTNLDMSDDIVDFVDIESIDEINDVLEYTYPSAFGVESSMDQKSAYMKSQERSFIQLAKNRRFETI